MVNVALPETLGAKYHTPRIRCWNRTTKEIHLWDVYGGCPHVEGGITVPQLSTGFYDRNGIEVFEGDIVRLHGSKDGLVEYRDGGWVIEFLKKGGFQWMCSLAGEKREILEIIGNRCQNSDWLLQNS